MARKNRLRHKRSKGGGAKRGALVVVLLVVAALIGGYLAVHSYRGARQREAERAQGKKPLAVERHQIPPKKKPTPRGQVLEIYTAANIPLQLTKKSGTRRSHLAPGSLALVIDDMGTNVQELDALMALHVPLTFSVIPQLAHARDVSERAHDRGYEVILHIPMEPKGYPQRRLEENGLLLSLKDEEIDRRLRQYLQTVRHADGANNHMGSRFTEDAAKMLPVLQVLKEKKIFFLDSKTTPLSVGSSLAHELGIRTASRNVFLDNVQETAAIRRQLLQAAQIARTRGSAIAICHPHKATIQALSEALPALSAEGITFVKLSQVVE